MIPPEHSDRAYPGDPEAPTVPDISASDPPGYNEQVTQPVSDPLHCVSAEERTHTYDTSMAEAYQELPPGCWDDSVSVATVLPDSLVSHLLDQVEVFQRANAVEGDRPRAPELAVIGLYRIEGEVGTGGFGHVYRAIDTTSGNVVAIKIPRADRPQSRWTLKELWAGQKVHHAQVVPVKHGGEHLGLPYIVSQFVNGPSLSEWLKQRRSTDVLPFRAAASLVAMLARGVECCHHQGVLHRDLKPGNILLQTDDPIGPAIEGLPERLVPRITDFGLARQLEGSAESSGMLDNAGTAAYMAPEQATGQRDQTRAVDIHALGVIFFELLTGAPPYRAETPVEILGKVVHQEPRSPRLLRSKLPRDLETIYLKCLQKSPERRYATAGALADDLEAYLDGRPIAARPVSRMERAVRWARRRPAEAILTAVASLAILGLATGAIAFVSQLKHGERSLRVQVQRVERHLVAARLQEAQQEEANGRLDRASQILMDLAQDLSPGNEPGFAWRALVHRLDRRLSLIRTPESGIGAMALSPHVDGRLRMAILDEKDRALALWDLEERRQLARVIHPHGGSVAYQSDPPNFVVSPWATPDPPRFPREIAFFDPASLAKIRSFPLPEWYGVAMYAKPTLKARMFLGDISQHGLEVRDSRTFERLAGLELKGELRAVSVSPVADCAAVLIRVGGEDWLELVEPSGATYTARRIAGPFASNPGLISCAFASQGNLLALVAGTPWELRVIDLSTQESWTLSTGSASGAPRFSPDSRLLAYHTGNGGVEITELASGEVRQRLAMPVYSVSELIFSPDSHTLYACSLDDPRIYAWHLDEAGRIRSNDDLKTSLGVELNCVVFLPDGRAIAVGGEDWALRLLPPTAPGPGHSFTPHEAGVTAIAVLDRGRSLATTSWSASGQIRLSDAASGRERAVLQGHEGPVRGLAASPDGRFLASAGIDRTVRLWDLSAPDVPGRIVGSHEDKVRCVAFSPDGRFLAAGDNAGDLIVYELPSGRVVHEQRQPRSVQAIAFSHHGEILAIGDETGAITLLSWPGREANVLRAHLGSGGVMSLAFHPTGTELASGGGDGTAALWDLTVGRELLRDAVHQGQVRGLAFAQDGSSLVSVAEDGSVRVLEALEPLGLHSERPR